MDGVELATNFSDLEVAGRGHFVGVGDGLEQLAGTPVGVAHLPEDPAAVVRVRPGLQDREEQLRGTSLDLEEVRVELNFIF
jgi:hypothetical protein